MDDTSSATVFQVCKRICNTLFHQCVAVVAIYVIWLPIQNYSSNLLNPLYAWHVILCTLGIIPLMAETIIIFSNDNLWSQGILRRNKYWMHGIIISVASVMVIIGISLEIENKERKGGKTHFKSAHAITGLIAMIFIIVALIFGPIAFTSSALKAYIKPAWSKFVHNILGQLGYCVGIVCLCLGYYTKWFSRNTSEESRILLTIVTVLIAIWSLIVAWQSLFNQIKSILRL